MPRNPAPPVIIGLLLLIGILLLSACGSQPYAPPPAPVEQSDAVEVEDCDFDDMLEGDSDCYGSTKSAEPKPKTTKPASRQTSKASTPSKQSSSKSSSSSSRTSTSSSSRSSSSSTRTK